MAEETQFDRAAIDDILTRFHPVAGRAFVVALDGPGGSDDFYADLDDDYRARLDAKDGYREYFDWQRLRDQVFVPTRQSRPIKYQRYDWDNARMGAWVTVPGVELLLIDGVYSSRPELREYADLVLWVTTSEEERVRRQFERGQNQGIWIKRWMAAESYYLDNIHQPRWAEVVVLGE